MSWLSREESVHGLREVAKQELCYDLLVKSPCLKYVPDLAEKIPELRMVSQSDRKAAHR